MNQKRPCALLMNDIHISKDNIPEFHKNWDEALSICKERDIDDLVIGGDLWQSRSSQTLDVLLAVRQAIMKAREADVFVTIAEGNHDLVDQESLLGYSHIFDGYDGVTVADECTVLEYQKVNLYVMSYFPENGSFTKRLEGIIKKYEVGDNDYVNILYCHQGIRGGLAQPGEDELPTKIFKAFDAVLVGHYHDRKLIPGTKIEYIGSSRQHTFGEDEEKGYTVLYDDGSYEFVKNQVNIRYKNMEVDYTKLDNDFIEQLEEVKADERYKVKVKVSCYSDEAPNVDKQKLIDVGATKVEIVTEQTEVTEIESHALDQKFDKSGIKDEYTNFCSQKEIDSEMGLQYLDKIN